jgi:Tfp pilus assembly PilM family ATPase
MAISSNQAGINLTISKLQLIEMSWSESEIIIENADEECLSGFVDKHITETELITLILEAYNQMAMRQPVTAKSVSFTLPTQLFSIVELPVDDLLTKDDITDHLNWEYSVLFPDKDPNDFLLRYFEIGNYGASKTKKILTAAIEKKILGAVHKFCMASGLTLRLVDNAHFAANLLIKPESTMSNYVSLYSDDNYFTMMIFEKGKPKYFRSLGELDLDTVAEKIKNEHAVFYSGQEDKAVMKNIFVSGESFTESATKLFETHFCVPLLKVHPYGNLKSARQLYKKDLINSRFYSFAAPVGIAARIS